jgi:DNA-binding response OmpR family regulator
MTHERGYEVAMQSNQLQMLIGGTPPVRLTHKESALWYELWNGNGSVVSGQRLMSAAWGHKYNWNDPDSDMRSLNRSILSGRLYFLRRLLEAAGSEWQIFNVRNEGYMLKRKG